MLEENHRENAHLVYYNVCMYVSMLNNTKGITNCRVTHKLDIFSAFFTKVAKGRVQFKIY